MTPTNYNHVGFYPTIKLQHRQRFQDSSPYENPVLIGTFPTISFSTVGTLTSVLLRREDGLNTQTVTSLFSSTTKDVPGSPGQTVNVYETNGSAPGTPPEPGEYFLQFTISGQTWYSDYFHYRNDVNGMVKIEFFHNEDFWMGDSCITSAHAYIVYLPFDVGRPTYPYEEEVSKRQGFLFPRQQISYKQHKIIALAPEHVLDCLRLARLMDNCFVSYGTTQYETVEFLMGPPSWQKGELASVEFEFITDLIAVVNGRGT